VLILTSLLIVGWVAASVLGTQAYFRGEQSKAIHARNVGSQSFAQVAKSITGQDTDFATQRVAAQNI
jgi:hypothetical protein